jgi:hypothetical protein
MSLFNSEQFGKDPRFWLGQIVDDSEWKENRPEGLYDTSDEVPGWGYRYKVRIFGKHPETGLQDVELPWADILYPVTSGSGHASSFQTPNLRKGNFVFGIYLDGKDETQPCIFGCFGNNDQTNLLFTRPPVGFTPTSGLYGEEVPVYSIPAGGSGPKGGPSPHEGTGLGDNQNNEGNGQELEDGRQESTLPVSEKCAKSLDDTQIELKKFIQRVEETQRRAQNWSYWVNTKGTELASGVFRTETIERDIQKTAQRISERIKDIINGIRQFITEKIDDIISDTYKLFFPEEEKEVEKAHNKAIDLITCLFNKIIANLIKMIGDLLRELVGRFINVPLCAVENILSGLLGQLLGLITGTLNSIFGPLSALIGSAIDLGGDILGFVSQILGFFLCDEDSACPENTKWSSWGGASGSKTSLDFNKIFNKTKEISENAKKIVDPNNFDFNLDFSSVFQDTCNVGPILCGPPTIDFTGGGGRGARGNAIVNLAGNILGVDIITSGSGYTRPPTVTFVDACGIGKGASAEAIMEDDENNPGKKKVKRVKIKSPGSGYLPGFDGSTGGDGRVFSRKDQKVVKRKKRPRKRNRPLPGPFTGPSLGPLTGPPDKFKLFTVVFVDWNSRVLKSEQVRRGDSATPPENPKRSGGYEFSSWQGNFRNVASNLIIKAQYTRIPDGVDDDDDEIAVYSVVFVDWDSTVLNVQSVNEGENATAPSDPIRNEYVFTGWDREYNNISSDLIVGAIYESVDEDLEPEKFIFEPIDEDEPLGPDDEPFVPGPPPGPPVPPGPGPTPPIGPPGPGPTPPIGPPGPGPTPPIGPGPGPTPPIGPGPGPTPPIGPGPGPTLPPGPTTGPTGGVSGGSGDDLEDQLIAGGTGGEEINVGGDSAVAGDLVVTFGASGGTQVVSGGFGGTPVTIGDIPLIAGGVGGTPIPNVTSGGLPVTIGGIGGLRVTAGGTDGTPVIITRDTPTITDSTSFGSYPVVLKLCAVEIESTGVNYSPNDTISVIPSNGAVLEPVFGPFGSIIDINIIDEGEGFTQRPEIVINTESGYNAELIPILCVDRIGDVPEELYKIPQGEKIIKVIDCVGKP